MSAANGEKLAKLASLANLRRLINQEIRLPQNVFVGHWAAYRFFESDNMFHSDFAKAAGLMLKLEHSTAACIVNLDRQEANDRDGAVYFLDEDSDAEAYTRSVSTLGAGYLERERFGSTSDLGLWCIYCENANDVGVLAVRDAVLVERLEPTLNLFSARPFEVLTAKGGPEATSPFTRLVPEWHDALFRNFC